MGGRQAAHAPQSRLQPQVSDAATLILLCFNARQLSQDPPLLLLIVVAMRRCRTSEWSSSP
jgi:hypothetical protein